MSLGSRRARAPRAIAALAAAGLLLAGCGQKGPLFLPDAGKQPVRAAGVPAPAGDQEKPAQKKSSPEKPGPDERSKQQPPTDR
jgi:predicted small lipoprotein YifL